MSLLDAVVPLADLPEGSVVIAMVAVVGYIGPDGKQAFTSLTSGDASTSYFVGLLGMASHTVIHGANPTPCEREDD